jgi:hypothetical protein
MALFDGLYLGMCLTLYSGRTKWPGMLTVMYVTGSLSMGLVFELLPCSLCSPARLPMS